MGLSSGQGLSGFSVSTPGRGDYLSEVDPSQLMDDPRFVRDLREYYSMNGKAGLSDEDLLREWYDDRTFAELNLTFGTSGDALDTYNSNTKERELKKRLVEAYHKTPFFWQDGGMGEKDAGQVARSIGWALATDPLTYVGPAKALPAAGMAVRAAAKTGKSMTAAGLKAGAITGAKTEAVIAAPIAAAADAAIQGRDVQLGVQDEFDFGQLGTATVAGGVLGGAVGMVGGGGAGMFAGRHMARKQQTDALNRVYNQRPGDFAVPSEGLGPDIAANEMLIDLEEGVNASMAEPTPTPDATGEAEVTSTVTKPSDINTEATQANLNDTLESLQSAHRDGLDPDIIEDLQVAAKDARIIHHLAERIDRENSSIARLAASEDAAERELAGTQQAALQQDIGLYRRLSEGQALTDPEDISRAEMIFNQGNRGAMLESDRAGQAALANPNAVARNATGDVVNVGPDGTPVGDVDVPPPRQLESQTPAVAQLADQRSRVIPEEGGRIEVDGDGNAVIRDIKPLETIEIQRAVPDKDGKLEPIAFNADKLHKDITNRFDRLHELRTCLGAA